MCTIRVGIADVRGARDTGGGVHCATTAICWTELCSLLKTDLNCSSMRTCRGQSALWNMWIAEWRRRRRRSSLSSATRWRCSSAECLSTGRAFKARWLRNWRQLRLLSSGSRFVRSTSQRSAMTQSTSSNASRSSWLASGSCSSTSATGEANSL